MYKLLIVDDEYEIRNGLCKYFPWDSLGFEVVGQFENGKQALDYIQKNHVDVILSDIIMPVMTGLELAEEVYKRQLGIMLVFLSGYRSFEYVQKALVYEAKNYIVKSTKYDELVSVFKKIKSELDIERQSCTTQETQILLEENIAHSFTEKIISVIKSYVQQNLKSVELKDIAELVHMHPDYVSKFFKQNTGDNFSEYLLKCRMEKAAELLSDIQLKTYEISSMVGYRNAKNFTRAFKSYIGKNPREFRNSDGI